MKKLLALLFLLCGLCSAQQFTGGAWSNLGLTSCGVLDTAICSSSVDASGNPNFLASGGGAVLNVNGNTTALVYFVGGQYQIVNSQLSITLPTPAGDTMRFIYIQQDTTNSNPVSADLFGTNTAPFFQYAAPTCPSPAVALSATNPSFWFDLSTNTTKQCTSNGGAYSVTTPVILLGVAVVTNTPTIAAALCEPYRLNNYTRLKEFGDGSDGALAITINTTKDGLQQVRSLLVDGASTTLTHTQITNANLLGGLAIYSQTPVIISTSATVSAVGKGKAGTAGGTGAGANGAGGGFGGAGGGGGGGTGNAGGTGGNKNTWWGFQGNGGGGAAGTAGSGVGGAGTAANANFTSLTFLSIAKDLPYGGLAAASGAAGGGDGSSAGGSGGAAGGTIYIKAPSILVASGTTVDCSGVIGGNGAGGNTGGGGGGGGGVCILVGGFVTQNGTFQANAGGAGTKVGTGGNGGAGGAGLALIVRMW